jgi:hypothetical protein
LGIGVVYVVYSLEVDLIPQMAEVSLIVVADRISEGVFGLGKIPTEDLTSILRTGDDRRIVLDTEGVYRTH